MSNPFNVELPDNPRELSLVLTWVLERLSVEEPLAVEDVASMTPVILLAIASLRGVLGTVPRARCEELVLKWQNYTEQTESSKVDSEIVSDVRFLLEQFIKLRFRIDIELFSKARTMMNNVAAIAKLSVRNQQAQASILDEK